MNQWEVVYDKEGKPLGTVLVNPNRHDFYVAYRALPVCPGLNWSDTYPDKVSMKSKDREELIGWLQNG